ncbi:MAG: formylmethanofuran dehydrogenase [Chloroflexi bacterium]|nr:formylmethanofuran dehydrogenase [Chloroflexota bacterium]
MPTLEKFLEASAALHRHLCPRQVLGVRIGMMAEDALGIELPQNDKRVFAVVETDGCASDGIAVATHCWVGRRTMRVEDYGKVAATFVDTRTGLAVRIAPRLDARERASRYAPEAHTHWEAMLIGYQRMPPNELLAARKVVLRAPLDEWISRANLRVCCEQCGEEIMNQREVARNGLALCRSCAGPSYYSFCDSPQPE